MPLDDEDPFEKWAAQADLDERLGNETSAREEHDRIHALAAKAVTEQIALHNREQRPDKFDEETPAGQFVVCSATEMVLAFVGLSESFKRQSSEKEREEFFYEAVKFARICILYGDWLKGEQQNGRHTATPGE